LLKTDFGRDIDDVYQGVYDGPILGTGIAGVVRKVKHRETGVYFAVKCLNLGLIERQEVLDSLREEIFIMSQLDHPNILRLEEVYESETQIFLIQELCKGGDLFDRLDDQPDIHFTEAVCAKLVKQMLSAVRYLHSKGIVHRDLKLENFLFSSEDPKDTSLKMIGECFENAAFRKRNMK
jgi:calcium-dependent protein kinase